MKKQVLVDECFDSVEIYHSKRLCKKCSNKLELSRWFECTNCKPELGEESDFRYSYVEDDNTTDSLDYTDLEKQFDFEM